MQRVRSPPEFSACLSLWYFTFCERSACVAALVVLHAIKGRTRSVLPSLVDCGSAIEVSLPLLKDVLIPPRASWSRARVLPGGPRHYRWHGSPFVSRRACHNFRLDVHVAVFPIHSVVLVPRRCHVLVVWCFVWVLRLRGIELLGLGLPFFAFFKKLSLLRQGMGGGLGPPASRAPHVLWGFEEA